MAIQLKVETDPNVETIGTNKRINPVAPCTWIVDGVEKQGILKVCTQTGALCPKGYTNGCRVEYVNYGTEKIPVRYYDGVESAGQDSYMTITDADGKKKMCDRWKL